MRWENKMPEQQNSNQDINIQMVTQLTKVATSLENTQQRLEKLIDDFSVSMDKINTLENKVILLESKQQFHSKVLSGAYAIIIGLFAMLTTELFGRFFK